MVPALQHDQSGQQVLKNQEESGKHASQQHTYQRRWPNKNNRHLLNSIGSG